MKRLILVGLLPILLLSVRVGVAEPPDAIIDFNTTIRVQFVICNLEVKTAVLRGDRTKAYGCIDKAKQNAKRLFRDAKVRLANNRTALEALKDLYVYWLTSMDSLVVGDLSETERDYDKRILERLIGIIVRQNRLEIEQ